MDNFWTLQPVLGHLVSASWKTVPFSFLSEQDGSRGSQLGPVHRLRGPGGRGGTPQELQLLQQSKYLSTNLLRILTINVFA